MADWDKILKCWTVVEANFPYYGEILMTRVFTKYPEIHRLGGKVAALAPGDLAGNADVCALGITRLKHLDDMLKARGNHAALVKAKAPIMATKWKISVRALTHLTEALADIMGEKCGLDAAGQQDLKKVLAVCWDDFQVVYKQNGFPG